MSEPNATYPSALTQQQYNNIDHDVCGCPNSGPSAQTFFSTQGIHYNNVCGQLRGFQFGSPDGFRDGNKKIDSCYVDDISIAYDSNPRKHIWTFVNALTCDNVPYPNNCCPCNSDNTAAS